VIPNITHTGVSASSADRENDKRILNASVEYMSASVDSADAENDKISLKQPIVRV